MLSETLKSRLRRNRPMTSITVRIPVDVVQAMKAVAPRRGLAGYQTLLKAYLSEGLRRDEARFGPEKNDRLIEALKRRGVPEDILADAEQEARSA